MPTRLQPQVEHEHDVGSPGGELGEAEGPYQSKGQGWLHVYTQATLSGAGARVCTGGRQPRHLEHRVEVEAEADQACGQDLGPSNPTVHIVWAVQATTAQLQRVPSQAQNCTDVLDTSLLIYNCGTGSDDHLTSVSTLISLRHQVICKTRETDLPI